MKLSDLRWLGCKREDLPRILFAPTHDGSNLDTAADFRPIVGRNGFALGVVSSAKVNEARSVLLLVDDAGARELYSWIYSFSEGAFPLSQFARVVSLKDWEMTAAGGRFVRQRECDLWSCLAVGELISLYGGEGDQYSPRTQWLSYVASLLLARTLAFENKEKIAHLAMERLLKFESFSRFHERPFSALEMEPLWRVAFSAPERTLDTLEAITLCLHSAARANNGGSGEYLVNRIMTNFPFLFGDSIEQRVSAYHDLAEAVSYGRGLDGAFLPPKVACAVMATGAFLVGRGTSHSFLLSRLPREMSLSAAWLGLISGLCGPESLDPQWAAACLRARKNILEDCNLARSSMSDISWTELEWHLSSLGGGGAFRRLQRASASSLVVEIFPGLLSHQRLTGNSDADAEALRRKSDSSEMIELAVSELGRISQMAERLKLALRQDTLISQQGITFGPNEISVSTENIIREKRGRRRSK